MPVTSILTPMKEESYLRELADRKKIIEDARAHAKAEGRLEAWEQKREHRREKLKHRFLNGLVW
jgi:hypothetical protein